MRDILIAVANVAAQTLIPIIGVALAAAAAYVAPALARLLHIQISAQTAAAINDAAARGAGIAYAQLVRDGARLQDEAAHAAAVSSGAEFVMAHVGPEVARMGLTPDQVQHAVTGELGKLLAVDPTTSIAPPAPGAAS